MTRSSLRALELSAATQPSNYGGSAASGADNKLTVDLLSERDSVAGEPVAVPVKSAFSDDASSLKSLEYSQVRNSALSPVQIKLMNDHTLRNAQ
jgi:hypothetical protein